jgi:TMEM175 potassium channel family protein
MPAAYRDWILVRTLSVCVVLAASAAVAPFKTEAATYLWPAALPVLIVVNRHYRAAIRLSEAAEVGSGR